MPQAQRYSALFSDVCVKFSAYYFWMEGNSDQSQHTVSPSVLSTEENGENLNELPLCCRISYNSCQALCQRSKVWLARLYLKCRADLHDLLIWMAGGRKKGRDGWMS